MMTKKHEMAEWIFDFFRRVKANTGEVVMMRSLQNKLHELSPKERDMFVPVANELLKNGYFTYEEGSLQALRLTEKGQSYIYNPSAELDCCYDNHKLSPSQAQYMSNWHDSFVQYIGHLKEFIKTMDAMSEYSESDKRGLEMCRLVLDGQDVQDVERGLDEGVVSQTMLEKIEKINKNLVDVAVENLHSNVLMKMFLKRLSYLKIEQDKKDEKIRLNALRIPIVTNEMN